MIFFLSIAIRTYLEFWKIVWFHDVQGFVFGFRYNEECFLFNRSRKRKQQPPNKAILSEPPGRIGVTTTLQEVCSGHMGRQHRLERNLLHLSIAIIWRHGNFLWGLGRWRYHLCTSLTIPFSKWRSCNYRFTPLLFWRIYIWPENVQRSKTV